MNAPLTHEPSTHEPILLDPIRVTPDTWQLGGFLPVPEQGMLAVNAYLIRGKQPMLVDTSTSIFHEDYLNKLGNLLDPADLKWIWLTHMDPDHIGNLNEVLKLAPQATIVTTLIGGAKLGLLGVDHPNLRFLNHGESLDLGDRSIFAVTPPTFDAPETMGFFDNKTASLFTSDSFGALLERPAFDADELSTEVLEDGTRRWAALDTPWLQLVDEKRLANKCRSISAFNAERVLSSHLPPSTRADRLFTSLLKCVESDGQRAVA